MLLLQSKLQYMYKFHKLHHHELIQAGNLNRPMKVFRETPLLIY